MVLAGHWPQTKALMIEVGQGNHRWGGFWPTTSNGRKVETGLHDCNWNQEVDGNTHESGRALSPLLALLVAYLRILEACQELLTFRVFGFGSLAMTFFNSSLTIEEKVVALIRLLQNCH